MIAIYINTQFFNVVYCKVSMDSSLISSYGFEKPKTTVPTEKVKITISSNIPKDSIRSINETHSTDLP